MAWRKLLITIPLVCAAHSIGAAEIDYLKSIKPIFASRCYACHGALKQKGKLRLDTAELIKKGGEDGPAIVPGDASKSLLIQKISAHEETERMPPEGERLTAEQVELIRAWIAGGARAPSNEKPEPSPREHWAFQPPTRKPAPVSDNPKWNENPIDRFLSAAQKTQGLHPVSPAPREILLRRIYLDLIGLPPRSEEVAAFLGDTSPDAVERVVDRLLASPQYGEHWGRHWMDIWRYSDWYGLGEQLRNSQKHIWHWRDWIIASVNRDKPYDQMIREMLAGDELQPENPEYLAATGFLARSYYLFNRNTWLEDTVEHTSKAFLGLTINCAKCHDHKFDPITQVDYYRMRAFFEPHQVRLDPLRGEMNLEKDGLPRVFDAHAEAPTYLFIRGDEKRPDTSHPLQPGIPELFAFAAPRIDRISLPLEAYAPSLQPDSESALIREASARIDQAKRQAAAAQASLAKFEAAPVEAAPAILPATNLVKQLFSSAPDSLWKKVNGEWKQEASGLTQLTVGDQRGTLRMLRETPLDFSARFRFRILGGNQWKSVGICFDVSEGHEVLVYLSATQGSKLQVSYMQNGAYQYPPQGAQARTVPLNEPLDLGLTVCGRVLNISVNGQPAMAYELPFDRKKGSVDLITYDATARFEEFELATLASDAPMIEPGSGRRVLAHQLSHPRELELAKARDAARLASASLATAQAKLPALKAALEADRARLTHPEAAETRLKIRAASAAEKHFNAVRAAEELVRSEQAFEVSRHDASKKEELQKKLNEAAKALETAKKEESDPGEKYASPRVSRKAFEGPTENDSMLPSIFPNASTGRRTALADWITDRRNPLTARVAVNHVWLRHFGDSLAPNVFDLGRKSPPPLHQELLDWLAVDFMEHGWSVKRLHKLMITSQVYQLSSSTREADPETPKKDPDNKYYWRRNLMRMESQMIRDSVLWLGRELDLTLGGATVDPKQSEYSHRRSLYFTHSQEDQHRFLEMFDNAKVLECYRRQESIVPQQALAMSNSKLVLSMADKIAHFIDPRSREDYSDFVRSAFQWVLGRWPGAEESDVSEKALAELVKIHREQKDDKPEEKARINFVHALLNHNDFITIR